MRWARVLRFPNWIFLFFLSGLSTVSLMSGSGSSPSADRDVDFARDIRPILEASCNQCHGVDQSMNGLRLDTREAALKGGQSGPAILPGDGSASLLYRKILGDAPGSPMPLTGKLAADQMEMIRAWLDQGAPWTGAIEGTGDTPKKHWAYVKPVRPPLPQVKNSAWVQNSIDRFVLERLEREGLDPSPEASRETLVRRLTLDLIGLPPTPDEVDAFVEDRRPLAYERLVDRLLSSPRYGERWARPWLDLARYADTNGYIHDRRRNMWLYRDWVIKAINSDMPFDQFTIEQVAGDLLTDATPEQKIATGFHRNTMINTEGGTDPEEYRVAAILDRVETTGTVWLGSTIACAQCHDHKYDPITQEEYFRIFAFFNSTMEENNPKTKIRPHSASITLPPADYLSTYRSDIEREIVDLKAALKRSTPELEAAQKEWEAKTAADLVSWSFLDPATYFSLGGAELTRREDGSLLASGPKPGRETYVVVAETEVEGITAVRLETLTDPSLPHGGSSRDSEGDFLLTGFEVRAEPMTAPGSSSPVVFSGAAAEIDPITFGIRRALDGDPITGWSNSGTSHKNRVERQAIFMPESPWGFPGGTRFTIRLRHEGEKPGKTIGRFRFSVTRDQDPARNVKLPTRAERVLAVPVNQRTEIQRRVLNEYYRGFAPILAPQKQRLSELLAFWKQLTTPNSLVMKELDKPRTSHVFVKGGFLNPGKEVQPGVPSVLHPLPENETPPNRLTLARWLVSPENPLVGRVTMNRLWADHFGRPLVKTPENLGTQGERPTHPVLLDWLATEFVEQKWSMKAMHRLMVTSATYRQDSRMGDSLREKDLTNELYARGPRFRMDAEMIRDSALSAAGLLSLRPYGPSVFPPQPAGLWDNLYVADTWITGRGDDRYRRGLYTFLKRIRPYPFYANFDAPSRETTCVARSRSNTPLQALNLMNDRTFMEAARGLAGRMVSETSPAVADRIAHGFRLCLGRRPSQEELRELTALYQDQLKNLPGSGSDAARSRPSSRGPDSKDFMAWTSVAQVLLNLDETISRP